MFVRYTRLKGKKKYFVQIRSNRGWLSVSAHDDVKKAKSHIARICNAVFPKWQKKVLE